MAKWHISTPDGSKYEVETPDEVQEADVLAYAKDHHMLNSLYDTSLKGRQARIDSLVNPMAEGAKAGALSGLNMFQGPAAFLEQFNPEP